MSDDPGPGAKKPYRKPALAHFSLRLEEVLAIGCKMALGGPGVAGPGCALGGCRDTAAS